MADNGTYKYQRKSSFKDNKENPHAVVDIAARGLGTRHLQAVVMSLATFMVYSARTNLSVAIVAMIDYKNNETNMTTPELAPTYEWDEKTQGIILSAFFWGYFIMQLPAGFLTERFGGHRLLSIAVVGSAVLTILMPPCAYIGGWFLVCANRMVLGLIQAFTFPSCYTLLGVWAPPEERGRLTSVALGGHILGALATSTVSGFLAAAFGWPMVFYAGGLLGLIAGLIFVFFGADSPAKHRFISEAERDYIQNSLGGTKAKHGVPWKKLLTSTPVWATMITMAFLNLVFFTFLTKIPTYLATVLKFDMKDNGILSSLPYLLNWILIYLFSWTSDFLTDRGFLKLTTARKLFNSIGFFGAALCIILMSYANSRIMSVALLTVFMGIQGATFPGVQANFVDVAPNFSGIIFSIANVISAFLGILGPIAVGFIVTEAGSVPQWRIVFFLSGTLLALGNMIFIVWSTGETQPWNWPEEKDHDAESIGTAEEKNEHML